MEIIGLLTMNVVKSIVRIPILDYYWASNNESYENQSAARFTMELMIIFSILFLRYYIDRLILKSILHLPKNITSKIPYYSPVHSIKTCIYIWTTLEK